MNFIEGIKNKARKDLKSIILPETEDVRILQATERILKEGFANVILVGSKEQTKKLASGVYSFVASSYELRTQILGALEKYAVDNFLTGISFMDDGGYSLYRPEVQRGVTNYITGYGWVT